MFGGTLLATQLAPPGTVRDKSECHFRKTGAEYGRKSGVKRLSCTAKWQSDVTLGTVRRPDGSAARVEPSPDWVVETRATLALFRCREMLLLTPLFAYTGWFR